MSPRFRSLLSTGFLYLTGAVWLSMLAAQPARASLGEAESAVESDAQQLRGSVTTTERTNYRLHEIQLPSGTVLREFATAGGNVFAVAWHGPVIPDLKQALGQYFDVFTAAARSPHDGHHQLEIRREDFVMQSSGHMRAFSGRAYLPQALPSGVSLDELH